MVTVTPKKTEPMLHPPGCRCVECRVLCAALSGGSDAAWARYGFKRLPDGKLVDVEPQEPTNG